MMMDRAIFRSGTVEVVLSLKSIINYIDYIEAKENLFCVTPNCKCRLLYIPKGKRKAYFKKWKGYNHDESCPFFKETVDGATSKRIVGKTQSRIKDDHVNKVLKETLKRFLETDEEKTHRLEKQNETYKKGRNQILAKQGNLNIEYVEVRFPSTSQDIEEIKLGERNPPVKKRLSVLDFNFMDVDTTMSTVGFLKGIQIGEKFAKMEIVDENDRGSFILYLEQAFYENSSLNIASMLNQLAEYKKKDKHDKILITAVGQVLCRRGNFGMLMMDEKKLHVNGMLLQSYLISRTDLFDNILNM